jgi:hypothetical protein
LDISILSIAIFSINKKFLDLDEDDKINIIEIYLKIDKKKDLEEFNSNFKYDFSIFIIDGNHRISILKELCIKYPNNDNLKERFTNIYLNPSNIEIELFSNEKNIMNKRFVKTTEKNALYLINQIYMTKIQNIITDEKITAKEAHKKLLKTKDVKTNLSYKNYIFNTKLKDNLFNNIKTAEPFFQFSYKNEKIINLLSLVLDCNFFLI